MRGDDARDLAALGRGRQGDDRLAALLRAAPRTKSTWPPMPVNCTGAHRVGHDLAHEVDLDGRVDGHHVVVLADDVRVVDVAHREHVDGRVVVDEVVQAARAHEEVRHHLVAVQGLAGVGDDALVVEVDDALAEHLGVDAEVVLLVQEQQHRVGDAADAELQAGAVVDEAGDVLADGLFDGADPGRLQLDDRRASLSTTMSMSLTWMNESPWVRGMLGFTRAMTVLATCGGRLGVVDRDAERAPAVLVGRRDLDEHDVGRQVAVA